MEARLRQTVVPRYLLPCNDRRHRGLHRTGALERNELGRSLRSAVALLGHRAGNAVLFSLVITICFMGSIVTNRFWLKATFAFGTVGYATSLNGPAAGGAITLSYLESENWKRIMLTARARSLWDEPDFGRGWALYITLAIQLHAILQLRLLARRLDIAAPQRHRKVYKRGEGALKIAGQ
ncbi:DUF895 domain membrane protein [Colletotrichum higginsianum]|nr:DUF895 domain membrane protein [Colletotrichum higginsianum]